MSESVSIIIPGEPVAQGRGRACVINGHARVFDPKKSRNWKATAQEHMRRAMGERRPLAGALHATIIGDWMMPRSRWMKRGVRQTERRAQKPDIDNFAKAVMDAATGVVWLDDRQVVGLVVEKWTAAQGACPGVTLVVEEIDPCP